MGVAITTILIVLTLVVVLKVMAIAARPSVDVETIPGARTLVVLVHGLLGRHGFQPAIDLAKETYAAADFVLPRFSAYPWSNSDPYRIANTIELAIHNAYISKKDQYDSIVLVGYSMGAIFLRKALVWAYGLETDRAAAFGAHGRRPWIDKVERFVSLAGINRGWSLEPRPEHMGLAKYVVAWFAERMAMLTRTCQLMLSVRRGAPFVADLRVQWIKMARDPQVNQGKPLPLVIHLLGDVDDVVSRADSADLAAAKDSVFVTLLNTGHGDIAMALQNADQRDPDVQRRVKVIRQALIGRREDLGADRMSVAEEDPSVTRIIYVMHGIRDYAKWADELKNAIEKLAPYESGVRVTPAKYGFFPMGPFLLYWDRQKYVRKFMDEYTENLAFFPNAKEFDYVGHSNGTYILASALNRYKTLSVNRVFFAGSVVPQRYGWLPLLEAGRVKEVINVVASHDWVVAIFPRFFEFVAELLRVNRPRGLLDIGSAGFRGFLDGSDSKNRVRNLKFVYGAHGAAIDFRNDQQKLAAISGFIVSGDRSQFAVFETVDREAGWLDVASNICWVVWVGLLAFLGAIGYWLAATWGPSAVVVYLAVIFLVLNSL